MPLHIALHDATGDKPGLARFDSMMQHARARQATVLLEDNEERSVELLKNPKDMANVQAHRVVFENRRWWAGKVDRGQWGDGPSVNVANMQGVVVTPQQLEDLRQRLEVVREKRHAQQLKGLPGEGESRK